jgi:crotonobetainyl-CoA:carnitine CoA-transferase CaiB-like acyl-CoA transferase
MIARKRIIDLSRIIAGPYATMVLADFGCEVIKVESPDGDPTREWGPPWHGDGHDSAYFLSINRNKQSLALNLKEPKCRDVLYRLVAKSDAVV